MGLLDKLKKFNRDHDPNKVDRSKLGKGTRKVSKTTKVKKKKDAPKSVTTETKVTRKGVTKKSAEPKEASVKSEVKIPRDKSDSIKVKSSSTVEKKEANPKAPEKKKAEKRKSSGVLNMISKKRKYY